MAMRGDLDAKRNALNNAIVAGSIEGVRKLLPLESGLNYGNDAPLLLAASLGHASICELLIQAGADIFYSKNIQCDTALHHAFGYPDVCRVLIAAAGDDSAKAKLIHAKNKFGRTPMHMAATSVTGAVCRVLTAHGGDVNVRDNRAMSPLHMAAVTHQSLACRVLLDLGADINAVHSDGYIALSHAGKVDVARTLVAAGASASFMPDQPQPTYLTPFQCAITNGFLDVVRYYIEECGEDPAQRTLQGRTMLQLASRVPVIKAYLLSLKTQRAIDLATEVTEPAEVATSSAHRRFSPL